MIFLGFCSACECFCLSAIKGLLPITQYVSLPYHDTWQKHLLHWNALQLTKGSAVQGCALSRELVGWSEARKLTSLATTSIQMSFFLQSNKNEFYTDCRWWKVFNYEPRCGKKKGGDQSFDVVQWSKWEQWFHHIVAMAVMRGIQAGGFECIASCLHGLLLLPNITSVL